jgi:intein/homing endonuclease
MYIKSDITIERVRDLYNKGYSLTKVCELLNCTNRTIYRRIKNTDIKFKIKRKYPINEEFFYVWSHDLAYILGLFMADGCITEIKSKNSSEYRLSIQLQIDDIDILDKIRNLISPTRPIGIRKERGNPHTNNTSKSVTFSINISATLFNYLVNLGIKPRKTGSEIIPEQLPNEYIWSFILGFIDGDGGIYHVKNTNQFSVAIHSSSEKIINQLVDIIPFSTKRTRNSICNGKIGKTMYMVRVRCIAGIKFLKENLYKNTTLSLNRKRLIFEKVI